MGCPVLSGGLLPRNNSSSPTSTSALAQPRRRNHETNKNSGPCLLLWFCTRRDRATAAALARQGLGCRGYWNFAGKYSEVAGTLYATTPALIQAPNSPVDARFESMCTPVKSSLFCAFGRIMSGVVCLVRSNLSGDPAGRGLLSLIH